MCIRDRAVVVDYKFGDRDAERYRRQIGGYCTLLRGMGYARVEGYLWYVRRGEVERDVYKRQTANWYTPTLTT